ncbi:MAG: class I SAM-dependent methyltransferase [Solirubrobacteraceae bacterium]
MNGDPRDDATTDAGGGLTNKQHWESIGAAYTAEWDPPARHRLGERELEFIVAGLRASPGRAALDVGIGSGRILDGLLRAGDQTALHGIDIAAAMVEASRQRFAGEPRVRELAVCDVSREPLPDWGTFDFVSAIRMLKYNENWRDMVAKLVDRLAPGGVIVFSMSNRNSLNRISRPYAIGGVDVTRADMLELCSRLQLEVLAVDGFTKLPHFLYSRVRSPRRARAILAVNRAMEQVIGGPALAREIFVAARRG